MKTRMILAAMLLLAFGSVKAQETLIPTPDGDGSKINTIVFKGRGPLSLRQGDKLTMHAVGHDAQYRVEDSILYLFGVGSYEITVQNLNYLEVFGASSVRMKYGALRGKNLSVKKAGTNGIVDLLVNYDNVYVCSSGGEVTLAGNCNVFCGETLGKGRVNTAKLDYKAKVERSGDQWNMAFNLDDAADMESLQSMVREAQPFFDAVSNHSVSWDRSANDKSDYEAPDTLQLDVLMRELSENLKQLSDSVDWEKFEQDMEQWGADMEEWGRKMEEWADRVERKYGKDYEYHYEYNSNSTHKKGKRSEKKTLLLNPNWASFDAGLNMLFNTPVDVTNVNNGAQGMELRPLRSWYFGFNIADVGVAFNRRHTAGLFTGVGLGWNNFSWNNDITIEYDPDNVVYTLVPIDEDKIVKNSKYSALFLQVPLMFEVRPTRSMYIDAGVTGGLRIAQWKRVKFADGTHVKRYFGPSTFLSDGLNLFKLDASLRVGSDNLGFFANYALLPIFETSMVKVHPVSFGFSLCF